MREDQAILDGAGVQRGFRCTCGAEHMFPEYVYNHWNDEVKMACPCGKRYFIISGEVGEQLV